MKRLVQIALGALFLAGPAQAQFYSGNELLARCRDSRNLALGFVLGVYDSSKALEIADNSPRVKICLPRDVVAGQLLDIVCQRLSSRPGNRHLGAYWLAYEAIQDAYPCSR